MVSAFLFVVPFVPYATFRATALETPALRAAAALQESSVAPLAPTCPSGAPVCPDAGGPSSPLSPRAVKEASKNWEWKSLETPGWKLLMSKNFVVRGDVSVDSLRTVAAHLEEFLRMLQSSIGGDASGLMFSARVFSDPREFRRYAARLGAPNAESLYDPKSAEVVICLGHSTGAAWLSKTLAHEFTHEYMDRVWKRTDPLWFAEGMAEYFANFSVHGGRVVPGAVDREATQLLNLDSPIPLTDFLKSSRDEMYGSTFRLRYAEGWSLVHYLFSRNDGTVDLLLRGGTIQKPEEIEKGWKEHLKAMK
jgi:hypothetical protein